MGLPLFDKGFANFTIDKQYQNFTQLAAPMSAMSTTPTPRWLSRPSPAWAPMALPPLGAVGNGIPNNLLAGTTGYPRNNTIDGNLEYQLTWPS